MLFAKYGPWNSKREIHEDLDEVEDETLAHLSIVNAILLSQALPTVKPEAVRVKEELEAKLYEIDRNRDAVERLP